MIDLAYFAENAAPARQVLDTFGSRLATRTGRPSRFRLVPRLELATRERILELKDDVFGTGASVFDGRALDELEADPDAMLLVLEIGGRLEGFCFGYYETPGEPIIEAADFFVDSALVAPSWQHQGIGLEAAATMLLLVSLLGDVARVGLLVWKGGEVGRLLSLYHRLGFIDAGCRQGQACLVATLDEVTVDGWRQLLGLPALEESSGR